MKITAFVYAISLLGLSAVDSAFGLTAPVAQDASSTNGNVITPATGKASTLRVNAKETAFFRFDLSDPAVLPSEFTPASIVSATLRIYIASAKPQGDLTVHAITSDWSEKPSGKSAPAPGFDPTVLATISPAQVSGKQFVTVDLTDAVKAALGPSGNDFGFAITTTSSAKVVIASKEGPGIGESATLEIEANLVGSTGDLSAASLTLSGALGADSAMIANALTGSTGIFSGAVNASTFTARGALSGASLTLSGGVTADSATITNALTAGSISTGPITGSSLTLTGNLTLPTTTATTGIIYADTTPLLHEFGTRNFFAGISSGNLAMTGTDNAGVGFKALTSNTTGYANTTLGSQTLSSNTTGYANSAIGFAALCYDTDGYENTAVGYAALEANTNGYLNTACGVYSLFSNTTGYRNAGLGLSALFNNTTGFGNTATGADSLHENTVGYENAACGFGALFSNTTGYWNTAAGAYALNTNTTGYQNTAVGLDAMYSNATGTNNTSIGYSSLLENSTGSYNTADGYNTLSGNTTGYSNTANGAKSLAANTTGYYNTAVGYGSIVVNTTGYENSALGVSALESNTGGSGNVAIGYQALDLLNGSDVTGNYNIAIGYQAGSAITSDGGAGHGNFDIDIGNVGVAGEMQTIRIGTPGTHTAAYLAGISGATASGGVAVYVNASGQLGTLTSSKRFKTDIQPMGDASSAVLSLQPVTFRYKPEIDPKAIPQFGLIAEQVNDVCPDLVARDAAGEIQTVRYEQVNAMLLNEFLKEHAKVETLQKTTGEQQKAIETLTSQLTEMSRRMARLEGH